MLRPQSITKEIGMNWTSLPRSTRMQWLLAAVTAAVAMPMYAAQDDTGASSAQHKAAATATSRDTSNQQLKKYNAMRASKLLGKGVRNAEGKDIGKIEDLVVDMDSGKVRYAMLAFDPGLFSPEKLF